MLGQGRSFISKTNNTKVQGFTTNPSTIRGRSVALSSPAVHWLLPALFLFLAAILWTPSFSSGPASHHRTTPSGLNQKAICDKSSAQNISAHNISERFRTSVRRIAIPEPMSPLKRLSSEAQSNSATDPNKYELKFTWGGGEAQAWHGTISFQRKDQGDDRDAGSKLKISNTRTLSYQTNAPGAIQTAGRTIHISSVGPTTFFAFLADISETDIQNDQIVIRLENLANPKTRLEKTVSLKDILSKPWSHALDDKGNGIWIQRSENDEIKFHSSGKREIFQPGERFQVQADLHFTQMPKKEIPFRIRLVSLLPQRKVIWKDSGSRTLDQNSFSSVGPFSVVAGPDPGVYQLEIEADYPKADYDFFSKPKTVSRCWQWVVVGDAPWLQEKRAAITDISSQPGNRPKTKNNTNKQFDVATDYLDSPDRIKNWKTDQQLGSEIWKYRQTTTSKIPRLTLPRIPRLTRIWPAETNSETTTSLTLTLEPGNSRFITVELPKKKAGPAVLLLESKDKTPLKFSVVWTKFAQMNQKGKVNGQTGFFQPNNAWALEESSAGSQPGSGSDSSTEKPEETTRTFRRYVWLSADHKDGKYQLIITNKSSKTPLTLTNLQIRLLPKPTAEEQKPKPIIAGQGKRRVGNYLEVSSFFESFLAKKVFSKQAGANVNDWQTIYLGSARLADYAKRSGANHFWIPVRTQGGSLYPSPYSPTSPRSDDSIFNGNSRQKDRLDVVGFLLKDFHRNGLRLSPVLDFSGTNHAAERLAAEGKQVRLAVPKNSDLVARQHYNPISPDFQKSVLGIAEEFGRKYGNEPALDSLSIRLSPESNLLLPGSEFPLDLPSFQLFLTDTNTQWPANLGPLERSNAQARYTWLVQAQKEKWLRWRLDKINRFYRQIVSSFQKGVRDSGRNGQAVRVNFVLDRWQQLPQFQNATSPQLAAKFDWQDALHQLGIDLEKMLLSKEIDFSISWRKSAKDDFGQRLAGSLVDRADRLWEKLENGPNIGIIPGFHSELQNPLDLTNGYGLAERQNRVESIVTYDSTQPATTKSWAQGLWRMDLKSIGTGSWGIGTIDNPQVQAFSAAFAALPSASFQTVHKADGDPVVARQFNATLPAGSSGAAPDHYIYLANSAPWPVTVTLFLDSPYSPNLRSLVSGSEIQFQQVSGNQYQYQIVMPAYGLASFKGRHFRFSKLLSHQPTAIVQKLKEKKDLLFNKLRNLQNIAPMPGLINPDFELTEKGNAPAGWTFGGQKGNGRVTIDGKVSKTNRTSLLLENKNDVLWIRSNPIPPPQTGRLSVTAWVQFGNHNKSGNSKPFRVSIDGQNTGGKSFYRYAEIQRPSSNLVAARSAEKAGQWHPVVVHFDNIPYNSLSDVRVGFDFFGDGEIRIDSVLIYDRWIDSKGKKAIANRLGLAAYALETKGTPFACHQLLDDFWIDFLDHFGGPSDDSSSRSIQQTAPNSPSNRLLQTAEESGKSKRN